MNAGGNYNRPKVVNSKFEFTRIGTDVAICKQSFRRCRRQVIAIKKAALLYSNVKTNPIIAVCPELYK